MPESAPTDTQIEAAARAISLDLTGHYEPWAYRTTARLALEAAFSVRELDPHPHKEGHP